MKNHVKYFLFLFTVTSLLSFNLLAQTNPPEWKWAVSAGSFGFDGGHAIAVDDSGNIYVTGHFEGEVSFGGIVLKSLISISPRYNIFIAKLNSNGEWQWAVQTEHNVENFDVKSYGIAVDKSGNVYITGEFQGSVNFGTTVLSTSSNDLFLAKLDRSAKWIWAIKSGGIGRSIKADDLGNIYIAGTFRRTGIFGKTELKAIGVLDDIFVAKLDTGANWKWAVRGGDDHNDVPEDLVLDSKGNIYISGTFATSASFDSIKITGFRFLDIFVVKLDTTGKWLWANKAGGDGMEGTINLKLDVSKNIYVTGSFDDTANFGKFKLMPTSHSKYFIAKLNSNGEWLLATKASEYSLFHNYGNIAITNDSVYTYFTGWFGDKKSFGNTTLTSNGRSDIFIAKVKEGFLTNIQETNKKVQAAKIFPNPATSFLTIETSTAINTPIIITDITGRQVLNYQNNSSVKEKLIKLDVSSLSKGLYFISVNEETHKFIKE